MNLDYQLEPQTSTVTHQPATAAPQVMTLPAHPGLSAAEIERTMDVLAREVRDARWRRARRWMWTAVAIAVVLLLIYTRMQFWSFWWFFKAGAGVWAVDAAVSSRRGAVQKLSESGDPRVVGVLAFAARYDDHAAVRQTARDSLIALLPRVKASDASAITGEQMDALLELALDSDTPLTLGILRALEQIGDEKAIVPVERLTLDARDTVRGMALECLPYVQERARRARESASLLRAATRPTAYGAPAELLRPAAHGVDTPSEQLLRATGTASRGSEPGDPQATA